MESINSGFSLGSVSNFFSNVSKSEKTVKNENAPKKLILSKKNEKSDKIEKNEKKSLFLPKKNQQKTLNLQKKTEFFEEKIEESPKNKKKPLKIDISSIKIPEKNNSQEIFKILQKIENSDFPNFSLNLSDFSGLFSGILTIKFEKIEKKEIFSPKISLKSGNLQEILKICPKNPENRAFFDDNFAIFTPFR